MIYKVNKQIKADKQRLNQQIQRRKWSGARKASSFR